MEHVAEALRRDGVQAIGVVLVGTRRKLSSLSIGGRYGYESRREGRPQSGPGRRAVPARAPSRLDQDAGGTRYDRDEPAGNGHRLQPADGNSHDLTTQPGPPAPGWTPPSSAPPSGQRR